MSDILQELEEVKAAIKAVQSGAQEYKVGNMTVKHASLADLMKREQMLQQQLNEDEGGGIYVAQFDRR